MFNDVTLFAGTVQQAQQEGYPFDQNFLKVEEGTAADSLDVKELTEDEKMKVVIIGDETAKYRAYRMEIRKYPEKIRSECIMMWKMRMRSRRIFCICKKRTYDAEEGNAQPI